ncbi:meprin A subunit beta-like [Xenopus laevis]|uniref:Meprin A subunit beta-like n=1 Tax=Xenopus laevis TaxID=8355 RepID=A0A8J1KXX2_XENLA|nr:meprin A subunit beta-like [Xenopus laevis]
MTEYTEAEDVSHLNATQPTPVPTTTTKPPITNVPNPTKPGPVLPKECEGFVCENEGVCVLENAKAVCRCKVTKDWWYVGEKCERKVSSQDTLVIAVSSSVTIFAVMLIITLTSVFCLKKKHKKQLANTGKAQTTENDYAF